MSDHYLRVPVDRLRRTTDPGLFRFTTTADLEPLGHVIGQERAVRAIDFGIDMPGDGYNIYAMGAAGSGRTTAVRRFLNERAQDRPAPASGATSTTLRIPGGPTPFASRPAGPCN